MTTKNKSSEDNFNATIGNTVLGAVFFKSIDYKIIINKCDNAHLIPTELRNDFIDWVKSKAVELGLGKHCEHYYEHGETGETWVEVEFTVHCA